MKQQIQLFLVKGAAAPTITLAVEMDPTADNPNLPKGLIEFLRAVLNHAVTAKPLGYRVAVQTGPIEVPAEETAGAKTRLSNLTDSSRGEIERLVRMLSPSERVIWRSLKGPVPIGLRRAFDETAAAEARAEEFSNFSNRAAEPPQQRRSCDAK